MKIVIVGGGTAGWITAAMLKKYTAFDDIVVVDSSKIPIIGAGEGSTGSLPWFINDFWPDGSVNEIDFLRKTKGTIKLGINLKNWKGDGKQIYSPFHGSPTDVQFVDTAFYGSILKYDRSDYASMHSWMLDDNLTTFRKEGTRIVQGLANHSYHFDGVEVGKFFKEWCTKRGVKCIDSEVDEVIFDDTDNLDYIKLSNGDKLKAKLWFDCSGFARILMSKTKNNWISYKNHLPTTTAIPFSDTIDTKKVRFETLAEALNSGWMWKIPLQQRHGCGYVFCDAFQSVEKSIEELETHLGKKIEPIKVINFDAGRYENIWHKNIVAVGLSSHFLEPLQATSIHISITSLFNLIFNYLKGETYTENDTQSFNKLVNTIIDDYKDFIQMHYLAGRDDTPFWKFIKNELEISDKNKNLIEIAKHRSITLSDIDQTRGTAGYALWCHILYNSNLYDKKIIEKELNHYKKYNASFDEILKLKMGYNKLKQQLVPNEELLKHLKA